MASSPQTLDDILAPMTVEAFFADYYGKQPLHLSGTPDKAAGVLDWDELTQLINKASIWSSKSMNLIMDGRMLRPEEYCVWEANRDSIPVWRPAIAKVKDWIGKGASIVLNEMDYLSDGIRRTARALEEGLGGKAQANLYCSWRAHPAFASHYDTHDVFALHLAGEKTWNVYGCHFENPIAHPRFKNLGDEFHEQHKGEVTSQVHMKPGDLLYLPRGWYHDALADSATMHIAFGVTLPIGMDVLSLVYDAAAAEPAFRAPLPQGDRAALAAHMQDLAGALTRILSHDGVIDGVDRFVQGFRYDRSELSLPEDGADDAGPAYQLTVDDIALRTVQGRPCLVRGKTAVPVPPGLDGAVGWILAQGRFTEEELAAAQSGLDVAARRDLIANLVKMDVIRAA
jgi:ribosomal protein L16 Arg81 hydroxylase